MSSQRSAFKSYFHKIVLKKGLKRLLLKKSTQKRAFRTEHDDEGPQMPGQRVVPKKTTDWLAVGLGLWVVVVLAVGFGLWVVEVLVVGLGLLVLVVLAIGLRVVVVVGLKVLVVVGEVGVVVPVVKVGAPSSEQATNGSPVLPAAQKHSSPLSVT